MRTPFLLVILAGVGAGTFLHAQEKPAIQPATAPAYALTLTQEQVNAEIKKWDGSVETYFVTTTSQPTSTQSSANIPQGPFVRVKFNTPNLSGAEQSKGIPDDALEPLKKLEQLDDLYLYNASNLTRAGLEHLRGMTQLRMLYTVGSTDATCAGLESLSGLKHLVFLSLVCSKVTDAGLVHVKGLTQIGHLKLDYSEVSDAGLEHLDGLNNLVILSLTHTKVTDAGLEHLKKLSHLQSLDLAGTKVTDDGLKKLQKALPKCKITH